MPRSQNREHNIAGLITEDQWDHEFGVLTVTILDLEAPTVRATDPHHVWTACADGAGGEVIHSGFHRVNRIGTG